ncbi:MAG: hypothetical protein PHC92_10810 [Syntrophomonadaceae bacterium]|nr:hypothetical protein [Syntrophomonadaceae bacterium]
MKKEWLMVMGSIIVLTALTAGFFAAHPIKLIVKKIIPTISSNNPTGVLNQYSAAIPSFAKLSAEYDIPWQVGWQTTGQVLERTLPLLEQLQKFGSLVPVRIQLTTFDQLADGGKYLPAKTPVWHVVFKADGRIWVRTSGPAISDPKDAYSHTIVLNTLEFVLHADSGEQIFREISGGNLETTRQQLEELNGVLAIPKEQSGDLFIVNAADGSTVDVLLPRGMISEVIDPTSITKRTLTFWETLNLKPGTPVKIHGLTTKTGQFLAYALEAAS